MLLQARCFSLRFQLLTSSNGSAPQKGLFLPLYHCVTNCVWAAVNDDNFLHVSWFRCKLPDRGGPVFCWFSFLMFLPVFCCDGAGLDKSMTSGQMLESNDISM